MLKRRLDRLEARAPDKPRHIYWLLWREVRDPFAARDELLERRKAGSLTPADAAELTRLEGAIPDYELDLAV